LAACPADHLWLSVAFYALVAQLPRLLLRDRLKSGELFFGLRFLFTVLSREIHSRVLQFAWQQATSSGVSMIRPQTCPICGKDLAADAALESDFFPFCSKRCRQVDLYRWSEGKYAVIEPLTADDLDAESFDGQGDAFDPDAFREDDGSS
jgi:endogenous inhibitor of DNA gyrase (YacG/DUF329 family)